MKCLKCGNELGANDMFCPACGTPVKKTNEEVKNQNTYNYDRSVNQQANYGAQTNKYSNQYANQYGQQYGRSRNASDIIKICVTTGLVFIILVCIFLIGKAIFNGNNKINNTNTSKDNSVTTSNIINGSGTLQPVSSVSTSKANSYKVSFNGFKLYISDKLTYEMDYLNDAINIGDTDSTWVAQLTIVEGSYKEVKQKKNYISTMATQAYPGITVSNVTVEKIDGVEYILIECSMYGVNMLMGYAELNSMYTACFELVNENNDFDRSVLKNISPIISNAEYTGTSSYMKSNENIKLDGLKKAAEDVIKSDEE